MLHLVFRKQCDAKWLIKRFRSCWNQLQWRTYVLLWNYLKWKQPWLFQYQTDELGILRDQQKIEIISSHFEHASLSVPCQLFSYAVKVVKDAHSLDCFQAADKTHRIWVQKTGRNSYFMGEGLVRYFSQWCSHLFSWKISKPS